MNMKHAGKKDKLHHDVTGKDIFESTDARVIEYRRKWEENPKKLDPGDFPVHLDIEVTSVCNLECPFCSTTYSKYDVQNGFIKWETVKAVLDEGADKGAYSCKFNFRGEPLLHKEIGRFIKYAKDKNFVDVFFNTNGVLLTEEKCRMLIDSGLDRITISLEGFEKLLYEKYRVGAKFENVLSNIEKLRNLREKLGCTKPKIRVQAVLIPELERRLDEFITFWRDKVDQVSYNEMLNNVPNGIKLLHSTWICPFPYQRLMIMWDGTVTACYNDHYGKLKLGNVHESSLQEMWNSTFENLRKGHKEGKAHEFKACAECPLRMNEIVKRGEILRI